MKKTIEREPQHGAQTVYHSYYGIYTGRPIHTFRNLNHDKSYCSDNSMTRLARDVDPALTHCWASIPDAVPTLTQCWWPAMIISLDSDTVPSPFLNASGPVTRC